MNQSWNFLLNLEAASEFSSTQIQVVASNNLVTASNQYKLALEMKLIYYLWSLMYKEDWHWRRQTLDAEGLGLNLAPYTSLLKQVGDLPVQWIRIHLPMQRTWVQSLVQEDSTRHGATKLMRYNYWAHALETASRSSWIPCTLEPLLHSKRSHHNEKPMHRNQEEPALATTRERLRAAMKTQHSQKMF